MAVFSVNSVTGVHTGGDVAANEGKDIYILNRRNDMFIIGSEGIHAYPVNSQSMGSVISL